MYYDNNYIHVHNTYIYFYIMMYYDRWWRVTSGVSSHVFSYEIRAAAMLPWSVYAVKQCGLYKVL